MRNGQRARRSTCSECQEEVPLKDSGGLRRHPHGSKAPCPGSGTKAEGARDETRSKTRTRPKPKPKPFVSPPVPEPKDYPPRTPMRVPKPGGRMVLLRVEAYCEVPEGVTLEDEEQLLYDDTSYLYQVLDSVDNERFSIQLMKEWS